LGRCRHEHADGDEDVFWIFHDAGCCLSNVRTLAVTAHASILTYCSSAAYNSFATAQRPALSAYRSKPTARAKIYTLRSTVIVPQSA
jgi:hypothetical protein